MCFADIQHQGSELLLRRSNGHASSESFKARVRGSGGEDGVFNHSGDRAVDHKSRGPVIGLNQAKLTNRRQTVAVLESKEAPGDLTDPSFADFFSKKCIDGVGVGESALPRRGAVLQRHGMRRIGA